MNENVRYSENGFWVKPVANGYRIGLSAKGQDDLGDVAFFELLATKVLSTQEAFVGVEASKAVTEIEAPINGEVVAIHTRLDEQPELLNSTDTNDNWIVEVTNVNEADYLALQLTDGLSSCQCTEA